MKTLLFQLSYKGAIILGLLVAAAYQFTFYDNGATLKREGERLKEQIQEKGSEIGRLQKENSILSEIDRNKKILGTQFEKILAYVPEKESASEYIRLISDQAKAVGVSILELKRGEEKVFEKDFYTSLTFSIRLKGKFSQILSFLSQLTKIQRIINVGDFSIQVESKENLVTFSGSLETYRYLEKTDQKADVKTKGKG